MNDDGMGHIKRTSRRYGQLLTALIVAVPALDLAFWASFNHLPEGFLADLPVSPTQPLSALSLSLAFLVSLIPLGVALYGLFTLRALFKLYEKAVIFSAENVKCYRRLGYAFIAWVIANALFAPLISLVITFNNPPGQRALVAQFGIMDATNLIIGAVILLISWVMNEGRKLEDDQAYTV